MKICIDAGHGGKDPGAVNTRENYLPEKTIALKLAEQLGSDLAKAGHTVHLTRNRDVFIELQERCNISNRFGADLFVSIHCNAAESINAKGFEVLHAVNSAKGKRAASAVLKSIGKEFPQMVNRGLMPSKSTRYPRWIRVLHKTNAPAILVELGFISNRLEGAEIPETGELGKVLKINRRRNRGFFSLQVTMVGAMLQFQLHHAYKVLVKVTENPILKLVVGLLAALFKVEPGLVVAVAIVMLLDGITGIWHSIKKGDKIRHTIIAATVTKSIVYTIGMTLAIVVSNAGIGFFSLLDDITIGAILFTEVVSVGAHLAYLHSDWKRVNTFAQQLIKKGKVPTLQDAISEIEKIDNVPDPKTVPGNNENEAA